MINTVLHLESKFTKSIGFDSSGFYLSSLQFDSIESLRNQCNSSTSKRSDITVRLSDIQKIVFNDQSASITVYYKTANGKQKSYYLEGFPNGLNTPFAKGLAEVSNMNNKEERINKMVDAEIHYLRLGGTVIGTAIMAYFAAQPGTPRGQLSRLMKNLGPGGVCIIGGILLLGILYLMYKQAKNPANETIYSH